jgi:cholesterol oxidase
MAEKKWFEALVIGSGFGGSVTCCRLAARWPGKVLLLERGRRYPKGSFARDPHDFASNFWSHGASGERQKLRGLFDIRNFHRMDAVVGAGLGGGSLIYANVFMEPPFWVFSSQWPAKLNRQRLDPYYAVAKSVLGARPVPPAVTDPRRVVRRSGLYADFAKAEGATSKPADICVFFGKGYAQGKSEALAIGEQERNRYGASQTSCTYCGECDVGCNVHAKNTLDLNYLYAAEHQHGAQIATDCEATRIVPINEDGADDTTADGRHGYRVEYQTVQGERVSVFSRRVVVSAGTLGTNELLLRCRDEWGTLPRISTQLGKRFSGNGDFVSIVTEGTRVADPNHGPVITQYIDYNMAAPVAGKPSFLLEDASYPAFAAWYVEGLRPLINPLYIFQKLGRLIRMLWRRTWQTLVSGKWSGSVVDYLNSLLKGDMSYRSSVLLFMGKDAGDGEFSLRDGQLNLDWPQSTSRPLYDAIVACGQRFANFTKAKAYIPQPTWSWPIRNNITVHPLGGCALADSAATGVVSCKDGERGQVFGYHGLYVADGSLLPAAVGANPSATIAALAEWIAQDITGIAPDATLGVPEHA